MQLALALVFADAARPRRARSATSLATALAYPLVVLGLVWCLGLRAPAPRATAATAWSAA